MRVAYSQHKLAYSMSNMAYIKATSHTSKRHHIQHKNNTAYSISNMAYSASNSIEHQQHSIQPTTALWFKSYIMTGGVYVDNISHSAVHACTTLPQTKRIISLYLNVHIHIYTYHLYTSNKKHLKCNKM